MMEIFHDSVTKQEFYSLKELEKLGPKLKGIVEKSVKEILDFLVSDGLVTTEKIGTSNYFWSFPSTDLNNRKRKLSDLESELESLKAQNERLMTEIDTLKIGREDTEERQELMGDYEKARSLNVELNTQLQAFKHNDPEVLEKKKKYTLVSKEAANRWTDNIFTLQSFCKNSFNMTATEFNKSFGIPSDLDNIP
ncbi:meiotic nuclear division protein 1 [Globomyces pollinis-pini]|nr:meiotic nuclear division protein 1 [Globomyces pollinis-pini]